MPKERKKLLILAILEILRDYTDENHRMRQIQIIDQLTVSYQLSCTRKSVRQNLAYLQESGYPVMFHKGWYYQHEFTRPELDFLVNAVRTGALPESDIDRMVCKLTRLGGEWYRPSAVASSPQLSPSALLLAQAIRSGVQVSFLYTPDHRAAGENALRVRVSPCRVEAVDREVRLLALPMNGSEPVSYPLHTVSGVRLLKSAARRLPES